MLDLLVIWGHSSDDSISNPQVWRNRACKHAGLYPAFFKSGHLFPSSCLPLHHLLFFPSHEHPCFLDYYFERDFVSVVFVFLSISRSCSQPVGKQKKKQQQEPDGSIHGQPQCGMGMGYRLWELWFPLSFQKINVGTNSSAEQAAKTAISGHTCISPKAEGCLTFWTALNTSSCTCGTCILYVVCALCVSL